MEPMEHGEATYQKPRGTALRSLTPFLVPLLLVIATGLQLVPRGSAPLTNGEIRRLELATPNLDVPVGADLRAVDGRRPLVLGRETTADGELLRVEHLEPGTYHVTWAGRGYGGNHFPEKAAIVVVEAVDAEHVDTGRQRTRAAIATVLFAVLTTLGAVAARSARTSRTRLVAGGALCVLLGIWGSSGWSTPDRYGLLAMLLATGAGGLVLSREPRQGDAPLLIGAITVLVWPTTPVAVAAVLVTVVVTMVVAMVVAVSTRRNGGAPAPANDVPSNRTALLFGLIVVLVAGTWAGHAGVTGGGLLRAGQVADAGLDFAECAERDRTEKMLGRDCFRALGARLGANLPPEAASQALLSGLQSVGVRQDSQCRTAGGALSYAAARWGVGRNDPRALFVDLSPICDYSSMHGIVAGAFAHTDDATFASQVLALCAPVSPDEARLNSPEYSRQCWQAAGIAMGRRTRYADPDTLLFCQQAEPYGLNNCTDGYFQELIDQKARAAADPATRLHPEGASVLSLCSALPDNLAGGCYRYVGEEVYYEGGTRAEGLAKLQQVCTDDIPTGHAPNCWYALGMVSVRSLLYGTFENLAAPVLAICPNAPTEQTLLQCIHGGGNAIVGLLGRDAPIERICEWFPETRREEYCRYTEAYRDHLREGDPTR
jgi:hypothetical protein